MHFVPSQNIHHPEFGHIIIHKGIRYTLAEVQEWADRYGVDNVKGSICIGEL